MRRAAFLATLAAAVLACGPAAAHEFLIYFDFDSATVSARYQHVIDGAACYARHDRSSMLVMAHADTTGSADYNHALSLRRAQAVAAALTRAGAGSAAITLEPYGETRPAVYTGEGVPERLNRRATITHFGGRSPGTPADCPGVFPNLPPPPPPPSDRSAPG